MTAPFLDGMIVLLATTGYGFRSDFQDSNPSNLGGGDDDDDDDDDDNLTWKSKHSRTVSKTRDPHSSSPHTYTSSAAPAYSTSLHGRYVHTVMCMHLARYSHWQRLFAIT